MVVTVADVVIVVVVGIVVIVAFTAVVVCFFWLMMFSWSFFYLFFYFFFAVVDDPLQMLLLSFLFIFRRCNSKTFRCSFQLYPDRRWTSRTNNRMFRCERTTKRFSDLLESPLRHDSRRVPRLNRKYAK